MGISKLPLRKPLEANQGSPFNEQIAPSDARMTVAVEGGLPPGLKATSQGSRLTISGRPTGAGSYEVMIVETRTRKITINVQPAERKLMDTPVWDLLTGKRPRQ
jgi:hypothetical protein